MSVRIKAGVAVVYGYAQELANLDRTLYGMMGYNIPYLKIMRSYPDRVKFRYIRELVDMGVLVVIALPRGNISENTKLERFLDFKNNLINDIGECEVCCTSDFSDIKYNILLSRISREIGVLSRYQENGLTLIRSDKPVIGFESNITNVDRIINTTYHGLVNVIDHLYQRLFDSGYVSRYNTYRKPIVLLTTRDYIGVEMTAISDFSIESLRNNKISYIKVETAYGIIKYSNALSQLFNLSALAGELSIYYVHVDGMITSCNLSGTVLTDNVVATRISKETNASIDLGVEISCITVSRLTSIEYGVRREWLLWDGSWDVNSTEAKRFTCKKELLLAITKDEYIDSATGEYKLMFTHSNIKIKKAELEINVKELV